jgi:hypothetical protein
LLDELELLSDFDELELELELLSDFVESDFFSELELDDEPSELDDSALLLAEPLAELLAASRLSVR